MDLPSFAVRLTKKRSYRVVVVVLLAGRCVVHCAAPFVECWASHFVCRRLFLALIGLYWLLVSFTGFLLGFYWVFTGFLLAFYWLFTGFYWVLTEFDRV